MSFGRSVVDIWRGMPGRPGGAVDDVAAEVVVESEAKAFSSSSSPPLEEGAELHVSLHDLGVVAFLDFVVV